MNYLANALRGNGLSDLSAICEGEVVTDATRVLKLLAMCPVAQATPLVNASKLADELGIGALYTKDERARMGLGSFKALGAAFVIANTAYEAEGNKLENPENRATALKGSCFVTASAGNHGLSVAAGARIFGARAVIYLSKTVPPAFADRLRSFGADVIIEGDDYEASMAAAAKAARDNGWSLLSDSTWLDYDIGKGVMEGYLAMAAEIVEQSPEVPTHVFLQAGVGGLAAGIAGHLREKWGDTPQITVVEPDAAPALMEGIKQGGPVYANGPSSNMGRLDCKEPSHLALKLLARAADGFMTLSDDYVEQAIKVLEPHDLATTPSGGAGFAGLTAALTHDSLNLDGNSRVLIILSEQADI